MKLWFRQELAKSVEDAKNELAVTMHQLTAQSIHGAKARGRSGEKRIGGPSGAIVNEGGRTKTVRLVHDQSGKTIGAVISPNA